MKFTLLLMSSAFIGSLWAAPATFNVENGTDYDMTALYAREKGTQKWGYFGIGDGIAAGEYMDIAWNDPEEGECVWEFKATFEGGTESNVFPIDTCEEHDIIFE